MIQVSLKLLVASVAVVLIAGIVVAGKIVADSEARYRMLLEEHHISEHLKPDELTVVRVGQTEKSQPIADGLMSVGAEIESYGAFVVPGHHPDDETIYIFEDDLLAQGMDDPAFHKFIQDAAANHPVIVAVGDRADAMLGQALQKADAGTFSGTPIGSMAAFKVAEKGSIIQAHFGSTSNKDDAISLLEMLRASPR